jgi:hypothetical protein
VRLGRGLVFPLIVVVVGFGLMAGAYLSWHDQHSGSAGTAKVSSCTGHNGRYSSGVHCNGTWVTGGSLLAGGHVVIGPIENADRSDIGKTIDVRIHGGDHATKPNKRVSVVLALFGLAIAGSGVYLVRRAT